MRIVRRSMCTFASVNTAINVLSWSNEAKYFGSMLFPVLNFYVILLKHKFKVELLSFSLFGNRKIESHYNTIILVHLVTSIALVHVQ